MDNSLSSFIYTNITNDSVLQEKYNNLLVDYANSLFCKTDLVFNSASGQLDTDAYGSAKRNL